MADDPKDNGISNNGGPDHFDAARRTITVYDPFAPVSFSVDVGSDPEVDEDKRPDWQEGFVLGPGY